MGHHSCPCGRILGTWSSGMFIEFLDFLVSPVRKVLLNRILNLIEINKTLYKINTERNLFSGETSIPFLRFLSAPKPQKHHSFYKTVCFVLRCYIFFRLSVTDTFCVLSKMMTYLKQGSRATVTLG